MSNEPFYPLQKNYKKIEKMFDVDYTFKSYMDILTPNEVSLANEVLADKVYGETMSALIKRKDVKTIREIRDYILEKYEKNLEERLILDDYGIVLVRPDTFECVDQYIAFLESKGLYVEYQKTIKIDVEQYFMLYGDGMILGLSNNDDLFDFPTRTFNYINNPCQLLIVKALKPLGMPVSTYLHTFKGKHGKLVPNTLRGDIAFNALKPYTIDSTTFINSANVPLDPIGAYRALVRGEVESDGWHDSVDIPLLFYSAQAIHIPNRSEIRRDLAVLCSEDDIKKLIKKK